MCSSDLSNHVVTEIFASAAGIKLTHVPYKGPSAAMADVAGGQLHLMIASITSALPLVRANRVRVLGITSLTRSKVVPDVPTVAETLPGLELIGWYGVVAPKRTPAPVVARLNREIRWGLEQPDIRKRFTELGGSVTPSSPEEMGRHVEGEVAKWKRIVEVKKIEMQ